MSSSPREEFGNNLIRLLPRLRRFARVLTNSSHDGDDLVQSTLESAIKKRNQLNSDKSLDSWLFSILKSTWKNEIRSRAVRRGNGVVDADSLRDTTLISNQEQATSIAQLRNSVAALPENQRVVIALVDIEGMSYKEAAAVLEIPKGTLMSRLSRAREALIATMVDSQTDESITLGNNLVTKESPVNVH